MANPQKERGYTSIANEILESLAKIRIRGESRQVLDVIFRKTYGFNKKQDRIALSQFCLATNLKKPNVCRAINNLISMEIIIKIDNEKGEMYLIQKDFDLWKPLSKKMKLSKRIKSVIQKDNASLSKKIHTKETTTKDNVTKDTSQSSGSTGMVIDLFKEINPSYKILFNRKPQHLASSRLLEREGYEKLTKIVQFIKNRRTDKFCPQISSPCQLEEKWSALEKYALGLKGEKEKYKVAF